MPALLLFFLGTAGITAIIDAFATSRSARDQLAPLIAWIAAEQVLMNVSARMKEAMQQEPVRATRMDMPPQDEGIRAKLLDMDPFDFECHVMSFFEASGMQAWVTRRSNDFGIDGFAKCQSGLIVVQCKRYAPDNRIGRPKIQEFKGVIEESGAHQGWFVTTSGFTEEAIASATLSDRVVLIGMGELIQWHQQGTI